MALSALLTPFSPRESPRNKSDNITPEFPRAPRNSADAVTRRSYGVGSVAIAGYGRPDWAKAARAAAPAENTAPEPGRYSPFLCDVQISLLRTGDSGPQVKNLQTLLNAHGFDCGTADGAFGPRTAAALTSFQRSRSLGIDGEFGAQSFTALWNT